MNRYAAAALLAFALASSGCDVALSGLNQQVWREEKRFAVSATPSLQLRTFDGSIDVRTGGGSEILLTIERRAATEDAAKALEVAIAQNGNQITIEAKKPAAQVGFGSSRSVSFTLTVPSSSNIEARSGDGSIRVQGISGTVTSNTGDGSIKLTDVNGPIDVSSGDGSIAVTGKMSKLHARSGDGSVSIEAAPGSAAADDWDVNTGDGSVTLRLPADFNAQIDAHTGDGSIHVEGLTVSNVSGQMARNELRGTIGAGGRVLRIRTGDGSITLKR